MQGIAIIGVGCIFPGANGPRQFWQLLAEGKDAITRIPDNRWDADAFFDPDPSKATKTNSRYGGFVEDIDRFDAEFFGISGAEAARMDPQQKLFLETAYQALENAGLPVRELGGSPTGVFAGVSHSDHEQKLKRDMPTIDANLGVHSYHCFSANRISYHLNLVGPSLAVDTACSSALVAIHLACQSLRADECTLALAGGVNAHLLPEESICTSMMGLLSEDGRCRSFDGDAHGFARSEGCGVVVLKRLEDALRDGDQVLGVIRGSAVNHNGASNGITAPKGPAQQRVIARALAMAELTPDAISYVEAHATGTAIGDEVELTALQETLCAGRAPDAPLLVGSVKTNIGHLEAAAGVAGLIKVVLSMEHESLPAMLHFERLNPNVELETPVQLVTAATPWPRIDKARVAGISAFAFGGTNCHLILEEPPARVQGAAAEEQALTLSAKTQPALEALVARTAEHLDQLASFGESLAETCFSLNTGRSAYPFRCAVAGGSASQMAEQLRGGARFQGKAGRLPPRVGVVCGLGAPLAGRDMWLSRLARYGVRPAVILACDAGSAHLARGTAAGLYDAATGRILDTEVALPTPNSDGAQVRASFAALATAFKLNTWLLLDDLDAAPLEPSAGGRTVFGSLRHAHELPTLLCALWVQGARIDWKAVHGAETRRVLAPNYPFQRTHSWFVPSQPEREQLRSVR